MTTPSAPAKAQPKAQLKAQSKVSSKKPKLVRDSFTIPKQEFAAIDALKARALAAGVSVKKSELLRAGLMALSGMSDAVLRKTLAAVPTLKTGRPAAEANAAVKKAAPKKVAPKKVVPKKVAAKKVVTQAPAAQPATQVPVKAPVRKPAPRKA